jgi:iron complex outermembrane receptor protein
MLICLSFSTNAQELQDGADLFELSLEELMNLEIVAVSKKAESSFDAPLSSTVITKEEIINSGATTLEEVLRLVPGFIVKEETNGNYDLQIRGNNNVPPGNFTFFSENSMSLVMIDGRKVFNNMNGGTFWETLPISITDVERIEIVRGASTALYGPNAVNGVINFISKKSPDKTVSVDGNLMAGVSNINTSDFSANYSNSIIADFAVNFSNSDNKFKARISANTDQRDRFDEEYYSWTAGENVAFTDPRMVDYMGDFFINAERALDPGFEEPTGNDSSAPMYANYKNSKEKNGVNGWLLFDVNEDINIMASGGYQESSVQSVFMETSSSPISRRESESYNFNTITNAHGASLQVSGNFGNQDLLIGDGNVSEYDFQSIDAILEYDLSLGDLTLRPGVSYQDVTYDDTPYITAGKEGRGYLNDKANLNNFAYYLRGDYALSEKVRLIAALRNDHYNYPKDSYFTYQFIGTFKPNEKNILRASYAKANRGPVMVDFFVNLQEGSPESGQLFQYTGDVNMKLPTSNIIELGYRNKLKTNLHIDLEAFYSITENYTSFEPTGEGPSAEHPYLEVVYQYQNIKATTNQLGFTASLHYAVNEKLNLKAFGTYQQTELKDFDKKDTPLIIDPTNSYSVTNPTSTKANQTHEESPAFYGSITANYKPIEKLNVFVSINYTASHKYTHDYHVSQYRYWSNQVGVATPDGIANIPASTLVNLKASYKVYKNSSVFINVRNVFNNTDPEFGFADKTGQLYLAGFNIDL